MHSAEEGQLDCKICKLVLSSRVSGDVESGVKYIQSVVGGADQPPEGPRRVPEREGVCGQEVCVYSVRQEILHQEGLKTSQVRTEYKT